MNWRDSEHIQQTLEAVFNAILQERMHDVPVVNKQLQVQALPFRVYQDYWVGLLITPWFMNLMLLPLTEGFWLPQQSGQKLSCSFPSGRFEFVHAFEPGIDSYAVCSLFSPMFDFVEQAVALATASAAWQALFVDSEQLTTMPQQLPSNVNRRDLLRGRLSSKPR